jgi:hypothetical protein
MNDGLLQVGDRRAKNRPRLCDPSLKTVKRVPATWLRFCT